MNVYIIIFMDTLFSQCIYTSRCWDRVSLLVGAFVALFSLSALPYSLPLQAPHAHGSLENP